MKTNKIKVLFLLPALRLGGAEKQVVDLINHLNSAQFEVTLFTFENDQRLLDKIDLDRVRFHNVPKSSFLDFSVTKKIAKIIDNDEIDIIHCTLQISLLYGYIAMRMAKHKPKLIDAIHTTINRNMKYELFDRFLYTPLMRKCDAIIAVCNDQKEFWSRKYPSLAARISTVHNGIDTKYIQDDISKEEKMGLRYELGIGDTDVVIGMVAVIRSEKNHIAVLDAAAVLKRKGLPIKFLFVGGGLPGRESYLKALKDKAKNLGIADSVIWTGPTMTPLNYISLFDIGILFSTTETFSLSLLEYLAMGKPVVAADIGGTREMIHSGVNGFLIPSNDLNMFIDKLLTLTQDVDLRNRFAANARDTVINDFTVQRMTNNIASIFKSVILGAK